MFLKSLQIANENGVIRDIRFHAGLNLIVDDTPSASAEATGNNVGKTTVLMLIDFCLGASAKGIYTDPEDRKNEYVLVKNFLIDTQVVVTLTLTENLADVHAKELVIERNFLSRRAMIRRINGNQKTEEEFEATLTNQLVADHYGKKPTFPQIISHNIRYKELSLTNTLRTLNQFTRDDEYETLHLFLLGCDFDKGDTKQDLLAQIRTESSFKSRLESTQTRSAYETSLALLLEEIEVLDQEKASFGVNASFEADLSALNEVKYAISSVGAILGRLNLRYNLIVEAVAEISRNKAEVDHEQLRTLYEEVSERLAPVQKSFEQLVEFHNRMVEEKARYISKDIPILRSEIEKKEEKLAELLERERDIAARISTSESFEQLETVVVALNEKHRRRGEYETVIKQISDVDERLQKLNSSLEDIDTKLFSDEFAATIKIQLNKLNKFFAAVSQELYGEQYALKFDPVTTRSGQKVYKFTSFNTNFSSGKKQGEITCFDIAYTLFADDDEIPCYHFLLNDKKELMHDNQLTKIARLVERKGHQVQFVASILRDKLPSELNQDKYFVLKLSQQDKLFRIEPPPIALEEVTRP